MLLVIFGAGASYDSLARVHPQSGWIESRLPLATELFSSREMFLNAMALYPELNDIVPYLQHPRNNYLEAELQYINDTAKAYPPNYSKLLAARYYLQHIIRQCEETWRGVTRSQTNHAALLGEINRWRHGSSNTVLLATFNYDRLIEDALKGLAVNVEDANLETISNLRAVGVQGDYETHNGGFSDLILSRKTTEWLSSPPKK